MIKEITQRIQHSKQILKGVTVTRVLSYTPLAEKRFYVQYSISSNPYSRPMLYFTVGTPSDQTGSNNILFSYDGNKTFTITNNATDGTKPYNIDVTYSYDYNIYAVGDDKSLVEIYGGKITVSSEEPSASDGNEGDIWIIYEE